MPYYLIALLLVGIVQLIGCIIRLFFLKNKKTSYKRNLKKYLLMVGIYVSGLFLFSFLEMNEQLNLGNFFNNVYLIILPSLIAIYYWIIVYRKYE